jgi:preprotein translocase SecE subunit
VRMLTAILAGTLILAGGAWAWSRLAAVTIPIASYSLSITQVTGTVAGGSTVDLFKGQEKIGTGTVETFSLLDDKKTGVTRITTPQLDKGKIAADIDRVRVGDAAAPTFAATVAAREPKYIFPRVYLQAGVSGVLVLVGCFFLYRLVGASPKSVDFLVATDSEMKKVNWSTRQVIQDSTMVVIGATFLIGGYIFISDFGLSKIMEIIGVLQR